jgi:hypothetical protein
MENLRYFSFVPCLNSDISENKTPFPVISYPNAQISKKDILKDNRGKTGIYMWTNLKSGLTYVGSALNLSRRLTNYYYNTYLLKSNKGKSSRLLNLSASLSALVSYILLSLYKWLRLN